MKKFVYAGLAALALLTSCTMQNPLMSESPLPYGAPQFDKIKLEDYEPAIMAGIEKGKAEIDAIVENPEEPTFQNTIEAMEFGGKDLNRVLNVLYPLLSANSTPELQELAQKISPALTEYSLYISLNEKLFQRIKTIYEKKDELGLEPYQLKCLEDTYKGFIRSGANLNEEQKAEYGKISEELSLSTLKFGDNVLKATNAYNKNITDESLLAGLPDYVLTSAKELAQANGQEGWTFNLQAPSYGPFMKYADNRELRKELYMAYNTRAVGGEFDNSELVKKISELRMKEANILGYRTYADYALESRMLKTPEQVNKLLQDLMVPSLPIAKEEVKAIYEYAKANGFEDRAIQSWDFSYWSNKYMEANYDFKTDELKPYFQLEQCIDAVLGLASRLYGITFEPRTDLPVYDKDVKVFDVKDENGEHLALFYADFFPRESKRGGAWMTSFMDQSIENGVETRPIVTIVTNFTKPTAEDPSLITHDELTTFHHEFGHALHGMLTRCHYGSQSGTSVSRDFVELPSQIMENWCYEPEYLQSFAKHYKTGEPLPAEYIQKIQDLKNYNSAYLQVRQLHFGILDMAWHSITSVPQEDVLTFEKNTLAPYMVFPEIEGTSISNSITHLFNGGYAAGYYSYKWAEVLEADAFNYFKEEGIFNTEIADSFRRNILERGSEDDEATLYRNFRGHDPEVGALLDKLGIKH